MSSWSGVIPAAIGGVIGLIWGLVLAFACVGLPGFGGIWFLGFILAPASVLTTLSGLALWLRIKDGGRR